MDFLEGRTDSPDLVTSNSLTLESKPADPCFWE
jgi:hypothetical protein